MEFSRQEYCSGLPCPSPGDLPDPGIEPGSSSLQADSLPTKPPERPKRLLNFVRYFSVSVEMIMFFSLHSIVVVIVQLLSRVQLFVTPWTEACQASLSFTISWNLLKLMSIESVMPSNHIILSSCPQFFPASRSFPVSWLFTSGGQSIGASASVSVLPMNS